MGRIWCAAAHDEPSRFGSNRASLGSAANFVPEPKPGLSAVYLENDFSPLMRSAGEHLVSGAHIVQRQKGAYLRAQLSTAKQPRNSVQPFRTDFSVEKY